MATAPEEMEDLERIVGALLVNIGTLTSLTLEGMRKAGTPAVICPSFYVTQYECVTIRVLGFFANAFKKPVVFDPVGFGASRFRKKSANGESFILPTRDVSYITGFRP